MATYVSTQTVWQKLNGFQKIWLLLIFFLLNKKKCVHRNTISNKFSNCHLFLMSTTASIIRSNEVILLTLRISSSKEFLSSQLTQIYKKSVYFSLMVQKYPCLTTAIFLSMTSAMCSCKYRFCHRCRLHDNSWRAKWLTCLGQCVLAATQMSWVRLPLQRNGQDQKGQFSWVFCKIKDFYFLHLRNVICYDIYFGFKFIPLRH